MLILPPGHAEELGLKGRFSRRERWMVRGVVGAVAALAITLLVALALPGPTSSHGCIYLTVAGPVGAQYIYHCGSDARALCGSAATGQPLPGQDRPALIAACRKAGLAGGP